MKVILLKDMGRTGKEGAIIEAKDGYARNYLLPNGFALKAQAGSYKKIEELKKAQAKIAAAKKKKYEELKLKIDALSLTISAEVKADDELYGSVHETQILKVLKDENVELEKGQLIMPESMKKVGVYHLKVNLHPEVEASLKVWVVKK